MGDYNVQIISAGIKRIDDDKLEEFKNELKNRLPLTDSAYHATAPFISVNNWHHQTNVSIIVQSKYDIKAKEFRAWFESQVIDGIGLRDAWSVNFSEYTAEPTILYKRVEE